MKDIHTETSDQVELPDLVEEAPPSSSPPSRRSVSLPLTHRTAAKVLAFILTILMTALAVVSILGGLVMLEEEMYTIPEEAYLQDAYRYRSLSRSHCVTALNYVMQGDAEEAKNYLTYRNVASLEIIDEITGDVYWVWQSETLPANGPTFEGLAGWHAEAELIYSIDSKLSEGNTYTGPFTTRITLPAEPVYQDGYLLIFKLISLAYDLLYWIWVIAIAAVILAVACFVFLMCASGHRNGLPEVQPGWGTKVPFDLLTAAAFGTGLTFLAALSDVFYFHSQIKAIALLSVAGAILMVLFLGWCMSFALRVKLGRWWKNTLIARTLILCWHILKWLCKGLAAFCRGCGSLLSGIPLVWKTALAFAVVTAVECSLYMLTMVFWWSNAVGKIIVFWALIRIMLFAAVIALALMLRRLQKGGEALAAGDLSYQVDTRRMLPAFRRHGENLNSLGAGMTIALEQRLRSERMKTELITNVSHDIKTPLTSIINYADLIGKEQTDNEKIREYSMVLLRQSERLKRLIDDLVEASKASTGNLEVLLAPCEAGVMLTQAAGEYEQRLTAARLKLICSQPERPVRIMADGRRLWRVFDNLMNNICKYAQSGTRVYLTLEEVGDQAVISFKNTSREPLNLPADELMERFIRGDASRSTDGNGLGLSIAKSLTDLQKGTFELVVDGDLFKVVLTFPILP